MSYLNMKSIANGLGPDEKAGTKTTLTFMSGFLFFRLFKLFW